MAARTDPARIPRDQLFSRAELRSRGWTDAALRCFAPEHNDERDNPYYTSAAPMKFWLRERIERIEDSDEFRAFAERSAPRRAAAVQAVATKTGQLLQAVEQMEISVKQMGAHELLRAAVANYNAYRGALAMERGRFEWEPADAHSDAQFLARIQVNFLRHVCTTYDHVLAETAGRVGCVVAVERIRTRVYDAIAAAYPQFADECDSQMDRRAMLAGMAQTG